MLHTFSPRNLLSDNIITLKRRLFGHWFVYRFIRVFSTHMPSPPSPFKGRKRTLLGAHGDSLAFHAYYDTGHPFIGSSPRTSDILTCYLEFATGKVCRGRDSNTRPSAYTRLLSTNYAIAVASDSGKYITIWLIVLKWNIPKIGRELYLICFWILNLCCY